MIRPETDTPFDRTTRMDELFRRYPELIPVVARKRMYCVGCLLAPFHDIRDAASEHGIDEDTLYAELLDAVRVAAGRKNA